MNRTIEGTIVRLFMLIERTMYPLPYVVPAIYFYKQSVFSYNFPCLLYNPESKVW